MDSALIQATWQAGVLSALSSVLGQAITCYYEKRPFTISPTEMAYFVLFSLLSTPPNFWWQTWLEKQFPGRVAVKDDHGKRSDDFTNDKNFDKPSDSSSTQQLSKRNTAIKFTLDQTIGAAFNTILFIAGMDLLRGKPYQTIRQDCLDDFWPLIFAAQKLWPAVSIISFVVVPVQYRTTFGSIVGVFWGAYLTYRSCSGASR